MEADHIEKQFQRMLAAMEPRPKPEQVAAMRLVFFAGARTTFFTLVEDGVLDFAMGRMMDLITQVHDEIRRFEATLPPEAKPRSATKHGTLYWQ